MFTRRGFFSRAIGAVVAAAATSRAVFARQSLTTLNLTGISPGPSGVIARQLYRSDLKGKYQLIAYIPPGANTFIDIDDEQGGRFTP
jgi:hypothetical protein